MDTKTVIVQLRRPRTDVRRPALRRPAVKPFNIIDQIFGFLDGETL